MKKFLAVALVAVIASVAFAQNSVVDEPNPEVVAFRNDVYEFVEAYGVTSISVVAKGLGVTSQKVTPAIKALVEEGRLALVETIKRVNYYNVVEA